MACAHCAAPVPDSARFCTRCGAPSVRPPVSRTRWAVALGAALVVSAIGGLIAVLALAGGPEASGTAASAPSGAAQSRSATRTVVTVVADAPTRKPHPAAAASTALVMTGYSAGRYSLTVPASWTQVSDDADHSGVYRESRWNSPSGDGYLLIDYTVGFDGTPRSGADPLRDGLRGTAGYVEHFYGSWLGGRFWRWEFTKGGQRKVDLFSTTCGTGYALLGAASPARFLRLEATFAAAAKSFVPRC